MSMRAPLSARWKRRVRISVRCSREPGDRRLRLGLFGNRHLLEVLAPQHFVRRGRERGIELDRLRLLLAAALRLHLIEHGFRQPPESRLLRLYRRRLG